MKNYWQIWTICYTVEVMLSFVKEHGAFECNEGSLRVHHQTNVYLTILIKINLSWNIRYLIRSCFNFLAINLRGRNRRPRRSDLNGGHLSTQLEVSLRQQSVKHYSIGSFREEEMGESSSIGLLSPQWVFERVKLSGQQMEWFATTLSSRDI